MAAHAINRGEVPDLAVRPDSDFYFVDAAHPAEALAKVVALVRDRIPDRFGLHPVRDVHVLCPVNRGAMGAHRLNAELQAALNPPGPRSLDRAGSSFRIGDKVMQVRNDYDRDVSNGELGFVRMADAERGELSVAFEDRIVPYADADIDDLALAYATTIHKAQGSEYPAVVIPIVPQHAPVLRRSLLYTGVTRASRLVVLVGSRATLAGAVAVGEAGRRWSRLGAWLRQ
jgi:exodeoxyribonuclease V alpha subunit